MFCDAAAYDAGYLAPEEIAGRVQVKGRGGTVLQPGVDLLEGAKDFPENGPILIITDGWIEDHIRIRREHAFLVPRGEGCRLRPAEKCFILTKFEGTAAGTGDFAVFVAPEVYLAVFLQSRAYL